MKKLLLIGSDSVHLYNFLELVKDHFDEVLVVTDPTSKRLGEKIKGMDFSLRDPFNLFRATREMKKIISGFSPSLIHIHQANTAAFITMRAAKGSGIPTVLTAWGSDILLLPGQGFFKNRMVRYILRHAGALTSDSAYMAEEMKKLAPGYRGEILLANFGIGIEPVEAPKENIIYSNRLHKKLYRIDRVLEGFQRFLQKGERRSWKLIVAGTGEETASLEKYAAELGIQECVRFAGWVGKEENAAYYAKAKIFVSIPASDATAISLLEAMACGCLPVLSDLPANREWVRDGVNGIIVKDLSENFFERVLQLNEAGAMEMNRREIREKGTREVSRKKFISLYDKLTGAK